jgi:RHS repeat-associated protein
VTPAPAIAASQYNGFNQLLSVTGPSGTTSFAYDGNGNQTSKTDGLGTTKYAYNFDNRLVGIAGPSGSSCFEYDANGLRTKKSDSTGTRSYLLDGLSVVAEYAPDASKLAWYTQSLARIDEVLSVVNGQGKYWYETDALGSTYAMTNAAGAVVSRSAYDVFGERTVVTAGDVAQPFRFTGREHDAGSGLVYARARYLSPGVGRWNQPDRLGLLDGPNRYLALGAAPVSLGDPLGLFATEMHDYVIDVAFDGYRSDDVGWIESGSYWADNDDGQQAPINSYMHAMRAPSESLHLAILQWEFFIVDKMADAVMSQGRECNSRPRAMYMLGFGGHALMDYYSPGHGFAVWPGLWLHLPNAINHWRAETAVTHASPEVRLAVAAMRIFRRTFEETERLAPLGKDAVLATLITNYGRFLIIEAGMLPGLPGV